MSHTPGPWTLILDKPEPTSGNEWGWVWKLGEEPDTFSKGANIANLTAVPVNDKLPMDEQRANMRLIAAAPDLLEELVYLQDAISAGEYIHRLQERLPKIRAAIAKAKGEA